MKNVLVVAGDPSGDLHGAGLIRELKAARPDITVTAMGGARMREAADEFLFDLAAKALGGFIDPITQINVIRRLLNTVRMHLELKRPAAVVTIDFYGFNHQVLGLAKHRHVPAYYYVSPQVWASRPGRVQKLKRLVERMLLIFPFEVPQYRDAGVPCSFVGHPLMDVLPQPKDKAPLPGRPFNIGLLPGSRPAELKRHLPLFIAALRRIKQRFPDARAQVFASKNLADEAILALAGGEPGLEIVRESDYARRSELDFALTASGTATLENALLGIPMVVVYKVNWPTYLVAKSIVKIPLVAMPNILAGRELVPELIQTKATAQKVADAALGLLGDPAALSALRSELLSQRELLGGPGAAKRAAAIILEAVGAVGSGAPQPA